MPPYPVYPTETRILIVDDELPVVEMLASFLAADPRRFKLETATDGYEALMMVGSFKPAIRILGLTGYPDTIPAFLDAGADACLAKPVDLQAVQRELNRLLPLVGPS